MFYFLFIADGLHRKRHRAQAGVEESFPQPASPELVPEPPR